MRYYELIYILNSNIERKKLDKIMVDIGDRLKSTESKIINHVIWGKKKLAYPIKSNSYGTYVLAHYVGGDNDKLVEFDSWLKLSGLVIRHMIVKLDTKPEVISNLDDEKSEDEIINSNVDDNDSASIQSNASVKKENNKIDEESQEVE